MSLSWYINSSKGMPQGATTAVQVNASADPEFGYREHVTSRAVAAGEELRWLYNFRSAAATSL